MEGVIDASGQNGQRKFFLLKRVETQFQPSNQCFAIHLVKFCISQSFAGEKFLSRLRLKDLEIIGSWVPLSPQSLFWYSLNQSIQAVALKLPTLRRLKVIADLLP
ncbi:hypothetical protein TNCV_966341 [Trichonephila clavipes]|nr:hypothetical protein TNCV_966341 [Trichonephila clavipes]